MKSNNIFLSKTARYLVTFITSTPMLILYLAVCCVAEFLLFRASTKNFSPDVHRITIEQCESSYPCSSLSLISTLFNQGMHNDYGGAQYLTIQAILQIDTISPRVASIPSELKGLSSIDYKYYAGMRIASSGKSFHCIDYKDENWHVPTDDSSPITGTATKWSRISDNQYQMDCFTEKNSFFQDMAIIGDNLFSNAYSNNPYIAFYIDFNGLYLSKDFDYQMSGISIDYQKGDDEDVVDKPFNAPLNILTVYPEASNITPTRISFTGESLGKAIENGVYVIAEDLSKKKISDIHSFIYSVLLGVLLPFIIELIVVLINRWETLLKLKN